MMVMLNGFLMGLSLIIAIGPQNALLLKQGIRRSGVTAIVAVCILSDMILIAAGTAGVGVIIDKAPIVLTILTWLGVAYLCYFAMTCFRDAITQTTVTVDDPQLPDTAPLDTHEVAAALLNNEPDPSTAAGIKFGNHQHSAPLAPAHHHRGQLATKAKPAAVPATAHPSQRDALWAPISAALIMTWLNPGTYVDIVVMLGGMANQYGDTGRWVFAIGAFAASLLWFPTIGYGAQALAGPLSNPKVLRVMNIGIGITMLAIAARLLLHVI
ncbi:LysE/ArgO family amino acid transporter [Corynebacterium choanae]|uniref:Arginine exporter protein ArgO n=1 Tax=Corynebacterium choanae TaxID=1862358 RepID=A0A3G6J6C5_9CORY|nr:LysE/ArgO family amino acid transporter [Corynebacterium choanae]AZA13372.1 Arginine exporter protein ArgO [Corynebacterium choanae]